MPGRKVAGGVDEVCLKAFSRTRTEVTILFYGEYSKRSLRITYGNGVEWLTLEEVKGNVQKYRYGFITDLPITFYKLEFRLYSCLRAMYFKSG